MQIFLVGGAVRDHLLQRPIVERDYVVVGATPEQLLEQGFQPVGKDFPVFLHPESKDEYALARTERKQGHGYQGFEFFTSPHIRLEQDLYRRDLTINAMAMDDAGRIYDPYQGQADLEQRILRHVSDAFVEDPLRVLRVARFAARYFSYGFSIAPETLALMQQISLSGELEHLSAERVWKETYRALTEQHADVYFSILQQCGALKVLMPEVDALFGIPQRPEYHPEIDCGIHTLMSIQQACHHHFEPIVRFATLCHDLGKALTPQDMLPRHIAHEKRGVTAVKKLCQRLKVPTEYQTVAVKVCEYHLLCHQLFTLKPATIWKLLKNLDVLRRPDHVLWFSQACLCDARGRLNFENNPYPQADVLIGLAEELAQLRPDIPTDIQGAAIGNYLTEQRIQFIAQYMQPYKTKAT